MEGIKYQNSQWNLIHDGKSIFIDTSYGIYSLSIIP